MSRLLFKGHHQTTYVQNIKKEEVVSFFCSFPQFCWQQLYFQFLCVCRVNHFVKIPYNVWQKDGLFCSTFYSCSCCCLVIGDCLQDVLSAQLCSALFISCTFPDDSFMTPSDYLFFTVFEISINMLRWMQYHWNFLNSVQFDCSLLLLTAVPNAKPLYLFPTPRWQSLPFNR